MIQMVVQWFNLLFVFCTKWTAFCVWNGRCTKWLVLETTVTH